MRLKTSLRVLGAAAAALLLLGACTGDDDEGAITPATDSGSEQPTEPAVASPGEFGDDAVLTEVEAEDGKFLRVHFLAAGDGNELFEALRACTERYIEDYSRVECYAYASQEAFKAASVDPEDGVVGNDCWIAHLGQDRSGEGVGKLTNDRYNEEGCPA